MSVADVPGRGLALLNPSRPDRLALLMLCLHLTLDLLHDGQHRRGGVSSGDEHAVALNVFHVLIIGAVRGIACPCVPVDQLIRIEWSGLTREKMWSFFHWA